jgi:hypothetical protein
MIAGYRPAAPAGTREFSGHLPGPPGNYPGKFPVHPGTMPMRPGTASREHAHTGLTGSFSRWESLMTAQHSTTTPARPALSARNKAGLILAILLGLAEIANVNGGSTNRSDGPPVALARAGVVLGLVLVIAAIYMWVSRNRLGGRIVAGTLFLSAIPDVGALFISAVPAYVKVGLAALAVVAIVAVMLVLAPPKPVV